MPKCWLSTTSCNYMVAGWATFRKNHRNGKLLSIAKNIRKKNREKIIRNKCFIFFSTYYSFGFWLVFIRISVIKITTWINVPIPSILIVYSFFLLYIYFERLLPFNSDRTIYLFPVALLHPSIQIANGFLIIISSSYGIISDSFYPNLFSHCALWLQVLLNFFSSLHGLAHAFIYLFIYLVIIFHRVASVFRHSVSIYAEQTKSKHR